MSQQRVRLLSGFVLILLIHLIVPVDVQAQPITFPTSMETAEGQIILRGQGSYTEAADDPTDQDRELTDAGFLFNLIYGINPRTAVFVNVPVHDRTWEENGETVDASGLGDVEIMVRRHWHQIHGPGYSFTSSPILGIKVPTGSDTEGGFPPARTLGSGSWDGIAGWAFRHARAGKPHYFGNVQFRYTTEASVDGIDYERGNRVEADLARKAPVIAWETRGELHEILTMLELNFEWEDEHHRNGSRLDETGGTTLYVTPGLVYARHRMIAELAVQYPAVQNLPGDQLEEDYRLIVGFWWNF